MPSYETQAGTLWPTLALTASYAEDQRGRASRNSAPQPGMEPHTARAEGITAITPAYHQQPGTPAG